MTLLGALSYTCIGANRTATLCYRCVQLFLSCKAIQQGPPLAYRYLCVAVCTVRKQQLPACAKSGSGSNTVAMLCMIDVESIPERTIWRSPPRQRQYTRKWRPEHVLMIVLACLWVITIFRFGKDLDLRPKLPVSGSMEQFLDGPVALLGTPQTAPTKRKPFEHYHMLHQRPALATSNSSIAYPKIRWPLYDDTEYDPPTNGKLGNGTYANGSNPYMVIAYNGSFCDKQWPTHE